MKKVFALVLALMLAVASMGICFAEDGFKAAMVTDVGGVNDQGFNQSSWEGLKKCMDEGWATAKYLESKQEADYATNLDILSEEGNQVIWGIGYLMADALLTAAQINPENTYAIIDNNYGDATPANMINVTFKSQDAAFQVGYIAAKMSQTNSVGMVGGVSGAILDAFDYGYRAGVAYAAKEMGKEIAVTVQYVDSFTDSAKAKAIAVNMIENGADVIFAAAGGAGLGAIEAAKELNKYVIGADTDQNYLAPENLITSCMKGCGAVVYDICKRLANGEQLGGTSVVGDLSTGAVGYTTTGNLIPENVIADTEAVTAKIIAGEIDVPFDAESFGAWVIE